MPTIKELERWLSTSQAKEKMGKSRQGAMWMAENKRVRAVKTAVGWLYDPEDVEKYVERDTGHETENRSGQVEG